MNPKESGKSDLLSSAWWRSHTLPIVIAIEVGAAGKLFGDHIPQKTVSEIVQWAGSAEFGALIVPLAIAWREEVRRATYVATCKILGIEPRDHQ